MVAHDLDAHKHARAASDWIENRHHRRTINLLQLLGMAMTAWLMVFRIRVRSTNDFEAELAFGDNTAAVT